MKKISAILLAALCITALLTLPVFAAGTVADITGPATVRAGDTITVTLQVGGTGEYSVTGKLVYDTAKLELINKKLELGGQWVLEEGANGILMLYDNAMASPITGSTKVLTLTFKVKNLTPGTGISVAMQDVTTSDGSRDTDPKTVTYTATVAQPLSGNDLLASLTAGNATISPAFNANTTGYTAEVPFAVSRLEISATAADGKARVTVNSPNLTPGGTTNVTVTVTAENGSKRTYTIAVKREKDPNYVASGNNSLSGITVNGFLLSPGFQADRTEYVVWVPYETERVTVSGTAADGKAGVRTEGGDSLLAGQDNEVKVICTAEDGTEKVYTVTVKRAPAHDGCVEQPPQTEPTEPEATEPTPTEPTVPTPAPVETPPAGIPWWWLILAAAAGIGTGFAAAWLLKKKA